jgi:hypothetical protein
LGAPTSPLNGYDLKCDEPANLFSVLYERFSSASHAVLYGEQLQQNPVQPVYNEGADVAARDLHFALTAGGLKASGVLVGERTRSSIPKTAWRGPIERHINRLAPDALYAAVGDDHFSQEVFVASDEVFAIWPALTLVKGEASEVSKHIRPAATLPRGFDQPDWSLEHVLAYLAVRDVERLRDLELSDSERPEWFGRLYRKGYTDQACWSVLREALIAERLIARVREQGTLAGGWWRGREPLSVGEEVWFRSDQVKLWAGSDRKDVQTTPLNRGSEADVASLPGERGPERTSATQPVSRNANPARVGNPPGRPPEKREACEKAMMRDIENGILSIEELRAMKEIALQARYGFKRGPVRTARPLVLAELASREAQAGEIARKS